MMICCFHGDVCPWWYVLWRSMWCTFHDNLCSVMTFICCLFPWWSVCLYISDVCNDLFVLCGDPWWLCSLGHLCRLVTVTGNRDSVCKAFAAIGKKIEQVTSVLCVGGWETPTWMCKTVNIQLVFMLCKIFVLQSRQMSTAQLCWLVFQLR